MTKPGCSQRTSKRAGCVNQGVKTSVTNRKSNTLALGLGALLLATSGCKEVQGRRLIQQGNQQYRSGEYKAAVAKFDEAEKLVPHFPTLWLNKGYTCKQLIVPGSKTPESTSAAKCAIEAFKRYKELSPDDPRGDMLYTQTLYDADQFETLAKMYEERFRANPKDTMTVTGLMQVYSKWEKLDEALQWHRTMVELRPDDAESYYAVGTFIYQQLMTRGGGPDKQCWDPRPGAKNAATCFPPQDAYGDIAGMQRMDLADEGIRYLTKGVELRPTYTDAMAYINLLYRQKAIALFATPDDWQKAMNSSEEWRLKTLALLKPAGAAEAAVDHTAHGLHEAKVGEQGEDDEEGAEGDDGGESEVAAPKPSGKKVAKARKGKKRKGKR